VFKVPLTVAVFAVTEEADPTDKLGLAASENDKIRQKPVRAGRAIPTLKMKMLCNQKVKSFS